MAHIPKGNANMMARGVSGLSLVEVMVALFIGTFLITGALSIYANGYGTIQVTARVARMQESARYAMELLEPDIRAAGYWGATTDTESIAERATPADPVNIAIDNDCENNWAVHLERPIEGADGANPYNATCLAGSNRYVAGSDMLIVRHVADTATATADLQAGTLYMRADENRGELFVGTTEPAGYAPSAGNFALIAHAYYVSPTSDFDAGLPSLRRLTLENGPNPTVADEELLAGAEDLQVQYGIDTDADGSVNSYVDADPALDYSQVMSVRVWLRMRTDQDEDGFIDNATYTYADVSFTPSTTADPDDDRLRRILTSKTVALRNRVVELNGGAL